VCPFRGGTCWYEQHITGDVAFAAWQFWAATGNYQWMSKIGYPLLYDIATFWESRGMWQRCSMTEQISLTEPLSRNSETAGRLLRDRWRHSAG